MLGLALTGLVALGLLGLGVGALLAPRLSAQQYGISVADPRALAYLRAMGVRDLVLGVVLLLLAAAERRGLLAAAVAVSALVAVVDFVVVSQDRPPAPARARLLHAGGALGLLAIALVVASGR